MNIQTRLPVLAITLLLASAARAEEEAPAEQGKARASGEGSVWALGKGTIEYDLNGTGTLIVFDSSVNRVSLIGNGDHTSDGKVITFTGFKGTVRIEGPNVASRFSDGKVEVRGNGSLSLLLTGEGQYWLNDGPAHNWNKDGTLVGVSPLTPPAAGKPVAAAAAPPAPPVAPPVTTVEIRPVEIRTVPVYITQPTTTLTTTWVYYYDYPTIRYSWSTWPWYYTIVCRPTYVRSYCPPRPRDTCPPPRPIRGGTWFHINDPRHGERPRGGVVISGTTPCSGTARTRGPAVGGSVGFPPSGGSLRHIPPIPPGGGSHFSGRGPR